MGLDMYLTAEKYVTARDYSTNPPSRTPLYTQLLDLLPLEEQRLLDPAPSGTTLEFRVGYWRKANAIHSWFVQNVQGGIDECQKSYVDEVSLQTLKDLCETLLTSRDEQEARRSLPPTEGFFFGSYGIDACYWSDLESTVDICTRALQLTKRGYFIHYQSSW